MKRVQTVATVGCAGWHACCNLPHKLALDPHTLPEARKVVQASVRDDSRHAAKIRTIRQRVAERFKSLVGMAPLEYLTFWRMTVARNELKREDSSLAKIADKIGYESETASSLAFQRTTGCSPGRYRTQNKCVRIAA